MRNFSNSGAYIETADYFHHGTILVIRMDLSPHSPPSLTAEEKIRAICLAEVRWVHELATENCAHYGMGLKHLK